LIRSDLREAVQIWNGSFSFQIFSLDCTATTQSFAQENLKEHSVFFVSQGFGTTGDPLALARTLSTFDETTGTLLDADILLNAENGQWSLPQIDRVSILLHELGHVLGLQHFEASNDALMGVYPYPSGIRRRALSPYEKAAIEVRYQPGRKPHPSERALFAWSDAYLARKFKKARALLEHSPSSEPSRDYALGMIETELQNFPAAARAFERAIAQTPAHTFEDPIPRYRLASVLLAQSKPAKAREVLETIVKMSPQFYEALADLAALEIEGGNKPRARELLLRTLQLNPVHYVACELLHRLTGEAQYLTCARRYAPQR
jgi:tetratricopeptide (TPR) repeat protein